VLTVIFAGWAIDLFLLQAISGKGGNLWKSEAATVMKQTNRLSARFFAVTISLSLLTAE